MIKEIKKAYRGWKKDIAGYWGRLKTFHRIVFGITIAMFMVYAARHWIFTPLQTINAKLESQIAQEKIPVAIPTFLQDEEIPGLMTKIECMESSLAKSRSREAIVVASRPQITLQNRSDVLAEAERIILKSGLTLQERSPLLPNILPEKKVTNAKKNKVAEKENSEIPSKCPLAVWGHIYKLNGSFTAIYDCLRQFQKFAYPAKISNIEISLHDEKKEPLYSHDGIPVLRMKFSLELYYHDK